MRSKIINEAASGMRTPQSTPPGMRGLVGGQADAALEGLRVDAARIRAIALPADFTDVVDRRIEERVIPAFAALREAIGDDYPSPAPQTVGMTQFESGMPVYQAREISQLTM